MHIAVCDDESFFEKRCLKNYTYMQISMVLILLYTNIPTAWNS